MWGKLSGNKIKKIVEKSSDISNIYLVEYNNKTREYLNKSDIVKKRNQILNWNKHLKKQL